MRTCINYGANCVGCSFEYCIDDRKCFGMCSRCADIGCDNHPQYAVELEESS